MIGSLLRVLIGFVLACFVAGLSQVMFALTPPWLMSASDDQLWRALDWVLLTTTHAIVFSAPFALVAAAIGEWQSIRSWLYYALAGLVIAAGGFLAQYQGELSGQPTVANSYAIIAYIVTGLLAGSTYWFASGRRAGDDIDEPYSIPARTTPSHPAPPRPPVEPVSPTPVAAPPAAPVQQVTPPSPAPSAPAKPAAPAVPAAPKPVAATPAASVQQVAPPSPAPSAPAKPAVPAAPAAPVAPAAPAAPKPVAATPASSVPKVTPPPPPPPPKKA